LAGHATPPALLAYLVHGDKGDRRALKMPATAAQLAGKRAALQAHRSQLALSGKRLRRMAERDETISSRTLRCRQPCRGTRPACGGAGCGWTW
jgi:hypothetical protein